MTPDESHARRLHARSFLLGWSAALALDTVAVIAYERWQQSVMHNLSTWLFWGWTLGVIAGVSLCWQAALRVAMRQRDEARAGERQIGRQWEHIQDIWAGSGKTIAALRQEAAQAAERFGASQDTIRALHAAVARSEAELAGCRADAERADEWRVTLETAAHEDRRVIAGLEAERDGWRQCAARSADLARSAVEEQMRLAGRMARFERAHGAKGRFVASGAA